MEFASLSEGLFAYAVWLMLGCLGATFACVMVAMAKHRFFLLHRRRQSRIRDDIRYLVSDSSRESASDLQDRLRSIQNRYPIDAIWSAVHLVESLPDVQRQTVVNTFPVLFPGKAIRECFASQRMEDRVIALEAIGLGRIQDLEALVHVGLADPELAPFAAVALCRLGSQGAFHRVMALHDATHITNSQALAALARLSPDDRREGFLANPDHLLATYFEPPLAHRS